MNKNIEKSLIATADVTIFFSKLERQRKNWKEKETENLLQEAFYFVSFSGKKLFDSMVGKEKKIATKFIPKAILVHMSVYYRAQFP